MPPIAESARPTVSNEPAVRRGRWSGSLSQILANTLPDPDYFGKRIELFARIFLVAMLLGEAAAAAYSLSVLGVSALAQPWFLLFNATTFGWLPLALARRIAGNSIRRLMFLDTASCFVSNVLGATLCATSSPNLAIALSQRLGAPVDLTLLSVALHETALFGLVSFAVGVVLHAAIVPMSVPTRIKVNFLVSSPWVVVAALPTTWLFWGGPHPAVPWGVRLPIAEMQLVFTGIISTSSVIVTAVIHGLEQRVKQAEAMGQYHLEEKLGEGGMGVVYRARHGMLRRPTALKLLPPEKAGAEATARFEREVQLASRLTHPNTVTIYDYGRTPDGVFYYAMELLDGLDLETLVQRYGRMPAARVARIIEAASSALTEAHEQGLVHRDVKPSNLFLCRERGAMPDVVKVLDFGLVKSVEASAPKVSSAGVIPGTPMYMAPEALRGGPPDPRTDLYALGGVAYFLLTGREVFRFDYAVEVIGAHLTMTPEPPSKHLEEPVPADLEALVMDCLKKDPSDRPRSARELAERLRRCRDLGVWSEAEARQWWEFLDRASPGASLRPSSFAPTIDAGPQLPG